MKSWSEKTAESLKTLNDICPICYGEAMPKNKKNYCPGCDVVFWTYTGKDQEELT